MLIKRLSGAALGAGVAIGLGLSVLPTNAGYVVTLKREGSDVVANGSGAIDLTGLTFNEDRFTTIPQMLPSVGLFLAGTDQRPMLTAYTGITGPMSFGSGGSTLATSGTFVGVRGDDGFFIVESDYVSGSPLSDSATYSGQTFSSLGVTPGVYTWKWGTGSNQNFTLDAVVPEPSTWIMMLVGFTGLSLAAWRARDASLRPRRPAQPMQAR
jgi:hypothetical protein